MEEIWLIDEGCKKNYRYILSGKGFGNFIATGSLKSLKYILPNMCSRYLLNRFKVDNGIKLAGFKVAKKSKRDVDFDCVKQILCVNLLYKCDILKKVNIAVVIGDGYGYMTALLKTILPGATIICINLGRILFFDVYYIGNNFPDLEFSLNSMENREGRLIFWEAEKAQALFSYPVDLFINIASMQEMDMDTIHNYFNMMRSGGGAGYFYCCNRVEKMLPDKSIIRFDAYPWDRGDEIVLDEMCPWYQKFPILKPPFWKAFDGPTQHRLVKLCKQGSSRN